MADDSTADDVRKATATMWEAARQRTRAQVTLIEGAVMALLEGRLDEATRAAARRESHKIAGSAGMFGFHRASVTALELETFFETGLTQGFMAAHAATLVEQLHDSLESPERVPTPMPRDGTDTPAAADADDDAPPSRPAAVVLLADCTSDLALGLATALRTRGLQPQVGERHRDDGTRPAAAVVVVGSSSPEGSHARMRELDEAGTAVVALVPRDAGTAARIDALRAGARLLLDAPSGSPTQIAAIADAVVALVGSRRGEGQRILAVDDDDLVLLALEDQLSPLGAQVVGLSRPERFWAELNTVNPDLVFLDVTMPGLDGLELCRLLRSDPRWRHLPVIFLSARSDPATIQQVYAAGADDFVSKPVLGAELVARAGGRLERIRLQRQLAETDPLTGLANRRRLEADLVRLQGLADQCDTPLSLAVVDLDRFKEVNDRHGRAAGDAVLRSVSSHVRDALRGDDVVARLGGAELVVAMLGLRRTDAVRQLEDILEALARTQHQVEGRTLTVTASAGVAEHGQDGRDFETLYRAADRALGVAKALGRGRVVAAGAVAAPAEGPVDVAVVEDDEIVAELLRHTLTTLGLRCELIPDGIQALDRLTARDGGLQAKVILLDIDLPGRSGFDVLHALREAGVTERSAVLVVSARSSEEEALRALRLGASDHVSKPFSVPLLVEKLRRLLRGDR